MHNIKELRKNLKKYKQKFLERNFEFDIDKFEELDVKNRLLINEKEKLEQEKKILSKTKDKSNFEKSKKLSEEILKKKPNSLILIFGSFYLAGEFYKLPYYKNV